VNASRIILDLVERLGRTPLGSTIELPATPADHAAAAAWCARTGNELVSTTDSFVAVRRGRAESPVVEDLPARLWLYTNFDCNLACDYCCSRSSPRAPRRALPVPVIRRLVDEGVDAGVQEVLLTGGEPFLRTDLDEVVTACTNRLPTTLLTNGMLLRGRRLDLLRGLPRDRLTLQISLDSATPDPHDRHRGAGTWQRAVDGIRTARAEGFRVRVAATVADDQRPDERADLQRLLDRLDILAADRVIRPVARRGFADTGVTLTMASLVPEVTVTVNGVYWHPVAADHDDHLVTTDLFPLAAAVAEIRRRFAAYRRAEGAAAQRFVCA
jgi:pyruvate-formate lyase-activating enzyme